MADFVDYVERSKALQAWFESASAEIWRRIAANVAEHNPLMERLLKEGKAREPNQNG